MGLVCDRRWAAFTKKMRALVELRSSARQIRIDGNGVMSLLKRPEFSYAVLPDHIRSLAPAELWDLIEIEAKYEGYIRRQTAQNRHVDSRHMQPIPADLDFEALATLSRETRQKLSQVRPTTLGQASRISGVTPADVAVIHIHLKTKDMRMSRLVQPSVA
jgi:tRNA uridine 5-carboxymethylaminomethyl modification enzyme